MRRDSTPSRDERAEITTSITSRFGTSGSDAADACAPQPLNGPDNEDLAHALAARDHKGVCSNAASNTLVAELIPNVVGSLTDGAHNGGGLNGQDPYAHRLFPWSDEIAEAVAFDTTQVTNPLNRNSPKPGDACHPLAATAHPPAIAFNWQNGGGYGEANDGLGVSEEHAPPQSASQVAAVAFKPGQSAAAHTLGEQEETACTIEAGGGGNNRQAVAIASSPNVCVRRLTPTECERLQGFPDDYTKVPYRGQAAEKCADGPRYRALGNSMAVPVIRWICERIQAVEQQEHKDEKTKERKH